MVFADDSTRLQNEASAKRVAMVAIVLDARVLRPEVEEFVSTTERSFRFLRTSRQNQLVATASPAAPIVVDAAGDKSCEPVVRQEGGWWVADVVFEGQVRHIGKFGSETQAKRVAGRWRDALLGEAKAPERRRGEAGKPGAPKLDTSETSSRCRNYRGSFTRAPPGEKDPWIYK